MPSYKLTYFNGRGRAEIMRLIFAVAGQEYVDDRIDREEWPKHKSGAPFGQVPVLEVDGVKLCQSNACARYLARQFHLAGKTELEQAQVDMLVDCFDDSIKPLYATFRETDEAKKAEIVKKYAEEQLPGYLTLLEGLLKANHGGDHYFVGSDLTWADLAFVVFVEWTGRAKVENPLAKFPKLHALQEKVLNQPKVKAWIEKRPKTEF